MQWQSIRLELARTEEFPQGSASRAYLVHLPLNNDGTVDLDELDRSRPSATVRRFWPNERDISGYVIRTENGWAFSYRVGDDDDEQLYHLETHRIVEGEYLTIHEPDGSTLPFRVARIIPLDGTG
ncbi:hypothetical protein FSZ31_10120 [Sphingorhabdus soli]|uniref:Uncharacterized protein n=1 Tax=Flavisphingopyxis soli TaxID=2601267 RepID=A0A5C6UB50_9SPHN|nr:hypothetical protein FSZ31_10120 [Sphingorhabdus soli]